MTKPKREGLNNSKTSDSGGKLIFGNATLCSQFLRDYSGLEIFKDIQPEDIEDVTDRYIPMFTEERDSDAVKKVRLKDKGELFVVALIEHKSSVDYNVVMQLMRYMVFIWEDYEKKMEAEHKGISKTKDFKYPPVIPIVYYEAKAEWTAVTDFKDRIFLNDVFEPFIPDFSYMLFKLMEHEQSELMNNRDEISLIMLINRLKSADEFRKLNISESYLEEVSNRAPEDVLNVLTKVISVMLRSINVPEDDLGRITDSIKERKMGRLFEDFEPFDYQAWRAEKVAELKKEAINDSITKLAEYNMSKDSSLTREDAIAQATAILA